MSKYQVLENGQPADWKLCQKSFYVFSSGERKKLTINSKKNGQRQFLIHFKL